MAGTDDCSDNIRDGSFLSPADAAFFHRLHRRTIPCLDGIRAFAVMLVLYYHMHLSRYFNGPLGVLIFFTLSGFLITWLLLKEYDNTNTISFSAFYRRRTLRIFPAFYCFWVFIIITDSIRHVQIPWSQAWTAFFYLSNYHHALFRPQPEYIMHTWSLAVEEQFYILWPVLCFCLLRRGTRVTILALSSAILCTWAYRILVWCALNRRDYLQYAFEARCDALLVGCLLAVLLSRRLGLSLLLPLLRLSPLTMLFAFAVSTILEQVFGNSYRFIVGLSVEPLVTAIWIGQLVYNADTGLGWLFNTPVVRYLGVLSYPLYLYHGIGAWVAKPVTSLPLKMLVAAAGAVAAASVSYWVIERPFLALKNKPVRLWFRR